MCIEHFMDIIEIYNCKVHTIVVHWPKKKRKKRQNPIYEGHGEQTIPLLIFNLFFETKNGKKNGGLITIITPVGSVCIFCTQPNLIPTERSPKAKARWITVPIACSRGPNKGTYKTGPPWTGAHAPKTQPAYRLERKQSILPKEISSAWTIWLSMQYP